MPSAGSKTPPIPIMTGRDSPPREVQWMETHKERPEDSTRALDEHGRNPTAFETLTTALERHQSLSPAPPEPRIHYFPPRRAPPINTTHEQRLYAAPTFASESEGGLSVPPSPTRLVPGNYISPHEDAGLPGTSDLEEYSRRAANKIVRAHTSRQGFLAGLGGKRLRRQRRGKENDQGTTTTTSTHPYARTHDRTASTDADTDVESNLRGAAPMNPALGLDGGGGVLSALLTLYNEGGDTGTPTTATSIASIASTSGDELPESAWVSPPSLDAARPPSLSPPAPRAFPPAQSSSTPPPPNRSRLQTADPLGRSHNAHSSLAAKTKFAILPASVRNRRNGAGVLGALIASTGNITGVAAPAPSTLAPNITRPGYHLSRYSIDEQNVVLPPVAASAKERPKSLPPMPYLRLSSTSSSITDRDTLASKRGWTEKLRDLEATTFGGTGFAGWNGESGRSGRSTPTARTPSTDDEKGGEERWRWERAREREQEGRKEKRRKRKKAEVYITRHVAQIIQRQEFILKLTRALMMFGAPAHRLPTQIRATGRVLDIQVNCMYLPDVMLISFDDGATGTSSLKFIRQGSSLSLGKLGEVYGVYWSVIHDEESVSEASRTLDALMRKKQEYSGWQQILIGGMCSASICTVSFNGSFLDSVAVFPLGALLVAIQLLSVRNELYSNVFEITVATLFSFVSAALASTKLLCYSAIASSSVVLILPGFIVLCGALEILSRNIVSGSVRMCYAVVYSLFLGFGLAMGAEAYERITGHTIQGSTDYTCSASHHATGAWYQRTPSLHWAFLTVPMFSLFLSMRNRAPLRSREMVLLIVIACIGWVTNHFVGIKFPNQSDIRAAVAAFAIGVVANVYARFFSGNAFVIMITGIFFQVPTGFANGGLLTYASKQVEGVSTAYLSGFQTALQLISVAIGLTVGLGLSLALVHPIQSRRRAGGVFSL
ncbi:hypothetical protein B0H16DRAFT_1548054 [Mycena metata]|uniref:DUF1212-domain-containing protein n=1 Tax=Mycena metata TaxID=1033252 RepID=A0AAD7IXC7_9AGAR|nr:hypothetical protein B0H16DRAFT_1548054 [Mycena metata]